MRHLEPGNGAVMSGHEYDVATSGTPWAWPTGSLRSGQQSFSLNRALFLPSLLLLAASVALLVDCQVSEWCLQQRFPREISRLLDVGEMCAHGLGVLVIALAVYQLDHARRRFVPHVLLVSWGAGMVANVLKLVVARQRPHSFDFQGNVWSTFTSLFPFLSGSSSGQSFPSAHVAAATGLAVVMARLYPQGKWLFTALAVLAACQRIQGGAHYLSDVLVGATVGLVFAKAILSTKMFFLPARGSTREE